MKTRIKVIMPKNGSIESHSVFLVDRRKREAGNIPMTRPPMCDQLEVSSTRATSYVSVIKIARKNIILRIGRVIVRKWTTKSATRVPTRP